MALIEFYHWKRVKTLTFSPGAAAFPISFFFLAIWVQIYNCLSTELKATWSGIRFKAGRGEGVWGGGGRGEGQVIQGPGSEVLGRKVLFWVLLDELGYGMNDEGRVLEHWSWRLQSIQSTTGKQLNNQPSVNNSTINQQQSTTKQPPVNI